MGYARFKQSHHWDSERKTQGQPKESVFLAGDFHDVHVDRGWADLLPQARGVSGFLGKWFRKIIRFAKSHVWKSQVLMITA